MKWFNLTFEQSEKLTKRRRKDLRSNIRENKSVELKFLKDGIFLCFFNLIATAAFWGVTVSMSGIPNFLLRSLNMIVYILFIQTFILALVFVIGTFSSSYILEIFLVQVYGIVLSLFLLIMIFSIILSSREYMNLIAYKESLLVDLLSLIVVILVVIIEYYKYDNKVFGTPLNNSSFFMKIQSIKKFLVKVLFFVIVIWLITMIYLFLKNQLLTGLHIKNTIDGLYASFLFILLGPIGLYMEIYLLFGYEFWEYILPLYYLKKYQSEYETKYKMDFGGKKKK